MKLPTSVGPGAKIVIVFLAFSSKHIKLWANVFQHLTAKWIYYTSLTASNLGLLLQKEQNVKWGEGPSGKQAVGKTMEHGKLCWHIFNHK